MWIIRSKSKNICLGVLCNMCNFIGRILGHSVYVIDNNINLKFCAIDCTEVGIVADQGAGEQQTSSGRAAVSVQGPGPTAASSAVASATNTATGVGGPRECAGCGKRITERYLLKVSIPLHTAQLDVLIETFDMLKCFTKLSYRF